uniref:Nose resistant to fluoxetine protein 6-like n=1 Tax=Saccoglossus kowalevskii TaxID=10224 RepID=A0ABM0H066_SACKO|nr:PREDICTED: nose resistant to fluoxetine protein 6-like [Saccoglossus kowalevskii]
MMYTKSEYRRRSGLDFMAVTVIAATLCCCLPVEVNAQVLMPGQQPGKWTEMWVSGDQLRIIGQTNQEFLQNAIHKAALQNLGKMTLAEPDKDIPIIPLNPSDVSIRCVNDTIQYVEDIVSGSSYAIKMFDSNGKLPPGVLEGNILWIGAPEECRKVKDVQTAESTFNGKYCLASFPVSKLGAISIGLCFPDTCSTKDVLMILKTGTKLVPIPKLQPSGLFCTEEHSLSTGSIVMLVVIGVLLTFMIIGTVYDFVVTQINKNRAPSKFDVPVNVQSGFGGDPEEVESLLNSTSDNNVKKFAYQPGIPGQCILAFSVLENGRKILDTTHASGTLAAVHGIRVLSMWWVILGHSYSTPVNMADNSAVIGDIMKRFTFQAISNATFSVDTFFFLSGLLVTYLTLRELKEGRKINWFLFYFHRFWRLTPLYMFVVFFNTYLFVYLGDGPMAEGYRTSLQNPCEQYWWTNLLYINNIVPWPAALADQCYGVAWYLANDMQFHVISPFIIVLLYRWPKIGIASIALLMTMCIGTRAGLAVHHNLTSSMALTVSDPERYFISSPYYYTKPWTRICTYLIGMIVGYALVKTSCRVKIPRIVNVVCWAAAWIIALAVLYGLYSTFHGTVLSRPVDVFYMTVCRIAWGVAIGWLTFACLTGYGGPINAILSWKAWIPISRLTYTAYLIHIMVILVYMMYRDRLIHLTDFNEIYMYIAGLVLSYCASFVVSLMAEAPMMRLEKILLRKCKRE